jgi:hypothetical protein
VEDRLDKKDKDDKVVIGVGLGKFSSKTRLSSLHESFQSYFVQKVTVYITGNFLLPTLEAKTFINFFLLYNYFQARSLGYIVVGVNEYYTSKKFPTCREFVGQVDLHRRYCTKCQKYMHCDIMAGHNICNAVRGHLLEQQRPLYLQPQDGDGTYPWM